MTIYYCKECRAIFGETDIISGETRDADDFDNNSCCECHSDDIVDTVEYAVEILDGRDGEVWRLEYIQESGTQKAIDRMRIKSITQSEYILENAAEFVQFVSEREESERLGDIRLSERNGLAMPKYLLNA